MRSTLFRTGTFVPDGRQDVEVRIRALEVHLAALSTELAYLLAEMDRTARQTTAMQTDETISIATPTSEDASDGTS